jgi:hypothetical protein
MTATPGQMAWLFGQDVGSSSKAIWRHMVNVPEPAGWEMDAYPLDPDDLGRCVRLLDRFPEWRDRMPEMAEGHGPVWAALVPAWDEIVALYREEAPSHNAPKCYARMKAIIHPAEDRLGHVTRIGNMSFTVRKGGK